MTEGKREKPLGLDIDFAEALQRFIGVDPKELPESSRLGRKARAKKKGDGKPPPPSKVNEDGD